MVINDMVLIFRVDSGHVVFVQTKPFQQKMFVDPLIGIPNIYNLY